LLLVDEGGLNVSDNSSEGLGVAEVEGMLDVWLTETLVGDTLDGVAVVGGAVLRELDVEGVASEAGMLDCDEEEVELDAGAVPPVLLEAPEVPLLLVGLTEGDEEPDGVEVVAPVGVEVAPEVAPVGVEVAPEVDGAVPDPLGIEVGGRTPEVPDGRVDEGDDDGVGSEVGMPVGRLEGEGDESVTVVGPVGMMVGRPEETMLEMEPLGKMLETTLLGKMLETGMDTDTGSVGTLEAAEEGAVGLGAGPLLTTVLPAELAPDEIGAPVDVGKRTEEATEETPESAEERTDDTPGMIPDCDRVSEAGIVVGRAELEGVIAVVIPTMIPVPLLEVAAEGAALVAPLEDAVAVGRRMLFKRESEGREEDAPVPRGSVPVERVGRVD